MKQFEKKIHQSISFNESREKKFQMKWMSEKKIVRLKAVKRLTRYFSFSIFALWDIFQRTSIVDFQFLILQKTHKFLRSNHSLKTCEQSSFHDAIKISLRLSRCLNSTSFVSWRDLDFRLNERLNKKTRYENVFFRNFFFAVIKFHMKQYSFENVFQFSSTDLFQRFHWLCCRLKISSRFVTIMIKQDLDLKNVNVNRLKCHNLKCDEFRLRHSSLFDFISRFSEFCMLRNSIQQIKSILQKFVSEARSTRQIDVKQNQQITYRSCIMSCMNDKVKEDLSKNMRKFFEWSLSREESYHLRNECSSQKFDHSFCIRHYMQM